MLRNYLNKRYFEVFLLVVGLIVLIKTLNPTIGGDGAIRYEAIRQLASGQIPELKYSLIQPILSLPLLKVSSLIGVSDLRLISYFNLLIFLFFILIALVLITQRWSLDVAVKTLLIFTAASMIPHNLQNYYGEVLTSLLLTIGVLLPKRWWLLSSILIALATMNTPAILPAVLIAIFYFIYKTKDYKLFLPAFLSVLLVFGENLLKYGSVTGSPYLEDLEKGFQTLLPYSGLPGFSYPLFFGVLSIIFSFGKGIIFFIPGLLLLFSAKIRNLINMKFESSSAWLVFGFALILVYSQWWAWYGGNYWGPRFFLVLTFPASIAFAVFINHPLKRIVLFGSGLSLLALSFWVGVDGYVFGQLQMDLCWQDNYALESFCWYVPEFSALWRPFVTGEIKNIFAYERAQFAIWQFVVFIYLTFSALANYRKKYRVLA